MASAADPAARRPDRYETLGRSYRQTRREDPRIAERIRASLGDARSVLNVGAGTGSYEPPGLRVVAAEPAEMMIRQRPGGAAPALRAVAEALPLRDGSFDAAMALLTRSHHWSDPRRGLAELRRVASRIVLLLSSALTSRMWLTSEYFPAMARHRRPDIQPGVIAGWLAGPGAGHRGDRSRWRVRVEPLPLPATAWTASARPSGPGPRPTWNRWCAPGCRRSGCSPRPNCSRASTGSKPISPRVPGRLVTGGYASLMSSTAATG